MAKRAANDLKDFSKPPRGLTFTVSKAQLAFVLDVISATVQEPERSDLSSHAKSCHNTFIFSSPNRSSEVHVELKKTVNRQTNSFEVKSMGFDTCQNTNTRCDVIG